MDIDREETLASSVHSVEPEPEVRVDPDVGLRLLGMIAEVGTAIRGAGNISITLPVSVKKLKVVARREERVKQRAKEKPNYESRPRTPPPSLEERRKLREGKRGQHKQPKPQKPRKISAFESDSDGEDHQELPHHVTTYTLGDALRGTVLMSDEEKIPPIWYGSARQTIDEDEKQLLRAIEESNKEQKERESLLKTLAKDEEEMIRLAKKAYSKP
eukprot:TRINITY_DN48940_c0_g1_i1.p1 TRINITY_DN48940_c0_g1~~TRINITY_DN48940_c0_g1_i1.p1  ORF type:complete len:215 (-),score=28.46 TRINITY_DN48940_c0_g1_i1:71-715(-)